MHLKLDDFYLSEAIAGELDFLPIDWKMYFIAPGTRRLSKTADVKKGIVINREKHMIRG